MQAGPDSSTAEGETPSPLRLKEGTAGSPAHPPIWLDPSQAISNPQGQEAGVGSRKSGRRSAWWAGGTGRCRSVAAVNPHRTIQLRQPRGAEQP